MPLLPHPILHRVLPPAHPGASASGMFAMAPMMKQATMLLAAVAVTKSCRTSCCNPNPRSRSGHRAHDVRSCCGTQQSRVDATFRVMLLQHNDSVLGRRQCEHATAVLGRAAQVRTTHAR
jgi:hypothetical protein